MDSHHAHRKGGKRGKTAQKICAEEVFSFFEDDGSDQDVHMEEEEPPIQQDEEISFYHSADHLFGVLVEMFPHASRHSLLKAWNTHRPNLDGAVSQLLLEPENFVPIAQPQQPQQHQHQAQSSPIHTCEPELIPMTQNEFLEEWSGLTPPEISFRDDWTNSWDLSKVTIESLRNSKYNHADPTSYFSNIHHHSESAFQ